MILRPCNSRVAAVAGYLEAGLSLRGVVCVLLATPLAGGLDEVRGDDSRT